MLNRRIGTGIAAFALAGASACDTSLHPERVEFNLNAFKASKIVTEGSTSVCNARDDRGNTVSVNMDGTGRYTIKSAGFGDGETVVYSISGSTQTPDVASYNEDHSSNEHPTIAAMEGGHDKFVGEVRRNWSVRVAKKTLEACRTKAGL